VARLANIVRRAGTYHFRRVVPPHLRERLRRRELVRSLQTNLPSAAKLKADLLYRASERLFVAASSMLSQDLLARLVQDFYNLVFEIDDHRRLLNGALTEDDHSFGAAYLDDLLAEHRQSLARNRFDAVDLATTIVMKRNGLSPEGLGPGEHNQIKQAILRAGIDVTQELRARYDGDFTYEPRDQLLKATFASSAQAPLPVQLPATVAALPEISPPTPPTLSEVGAAFRGEQIAIKAWDRQTAAQAGATYRLFIEVCGDKSLTAYRRADADHFRREIQQLPADYSKAVRYKGLTVADILKVSEGEGAVKRTAVITQKTVKRHLSALSALWTSSIAAGTVTENIFVGFRFVVSRRASDQREMWNLADLEKLFTTPLWTGCKSDHRRSEPGSLIIKDERYWLPLIAVFSGMRQEEICQLHVEDVCEADGIHYFDVNDRPPRVLKNENSVRFVPIHRELIRLGFLDHVEACRQAKEARLFPRLQPGGADQRLGHAFSKWFTRYRKDVGIYRPGLDFHSFRHTATTLMHQSGVERAVIDHITGHTTPGETSRYTKASRLEQLQNAINRIDIGFDFAALTSGEQSLRVRTGPGRKLHPSARSKRRVKRAPR
jgi:integrase